MKQKDCKEETIDVAIYLGVHEFGEEGVSLADEVHFHYCFLIEGKECLFKLINRKDAYHLQNRFKRGYVYSLVVNKNVIIDGKEQIKQNIPYTPIVSGIYQLKTLKNLIATACSPIGTVLYVFGGGWNWQDTKASKQVQSIGVSSDWIAFFQKQNSDYMYKQEDDKKNSYYPYGHWNEYYYAGLDCSGYIGWILFNLFGYDENKDGYVVSSTVFAKSLANLGLGTWSQNNDDFESGDIVSIQGHVWLCVGTCKDGSIVILHSSPTLSRTKHAGGGVQLSAIGKDCSCMAYQLVDEYMKTYYPIWYARYPVHLCSFQEYTTFSGDAGKFSWKLNHKNSTLQDEEHFRDKNAEEILAFLFS